MMRRTLAALLACVGVAVAPTVALAADPTWRIEQPAAPPPPAGATEAPFPVPLGAVGDIQFWSPNRGLMTVAGNSVVSKGIYRYDGRSWTPLATVCGAGAQHARIAWAGPDEFWVIADVAPGTGTPGQTFPGTTLCRFRDGEAIASYAAPAGSEPWVSMNAASCNGPNDCWFAGEAVEKGSGGAFHLHWNGTNLVRVIARQGRPVTDLEAFGSDTFETHARTTAPLLTDPEPKPLLIKRLVPGPSTADAIVADPFVPATNPAFDLNALDANEDHLWAAGSVLGVTTPNDLFAVRNTGGEFVDLRSTLPFTPVDIAAVPGTPFAWAALRGTRQDVLLLDASKKVGSNAVRNVSLPLSSDPSPIATSGNLGEPAKIACPAVDDCWMATDQGWLYHLTDGAEKAVDDTSSFSRLITRRPADASTAAEVSDDPPPDDSGAELPFIDTTLPASTDTTILQDDEVILPEAERVRVRALSRTRIQISFRLTLRAKVKVTALSRKKVIAQSRRRTLREGTHRVTLKVSPKRWPSSIKLDVRAP